MYATVHPCIGWCLKSEYNNVDNVAFYQTYNIGHLVGVNIVCKARTIVT